MTDQICIVIPTYNNAGTIGRVVTEARQSGLRVIVVDDGCTDATADILAGLPDVHTVSYTPNRGKGYALREGFREARRLGFDYVITMDADGQHAAADLPALLQAHREHPDALIVGSRDLHAGNMPGKNTFANKFSNFWFTLQTARRLPDTQTGYRLYPLKRIGGLRWMTRRYEAELALLVFSAWRGVQLLPTPVSVYYPPKDERVTHFRPGRDFARISCLNTLLCFLAVVYGYPMMRWHKLHPRS